MKLPSAKYAKTEQLTGLEGSNDECVETTNYLIILERRYHLLPPTNNILACISKHTKSFMYWLYFL